MSNNIPIRNRSARPERAIQDINDERLASYIENAFRAAMRRAGITVSEATVELARDAGRKVTADIRIFGMAGDVTSREFFNKKTGQVANGGQEFKLAVEGYGQAEFRFQNLTNLNGTEFQVTYQQV